MTRAELETLVAATERLLADRIRIVRIICEPDGREVGQINRGSYGTHGQRERVVDKLVTKGRKR